MASISSSAYCNKIYELRTYNIKPTCMGDYLQLTKDKFHLRTAHSRVVGFWITELGGVNEAVHLWEYDSLSHRASVRAALAKDNNWMEQYLSKAFQYFEKQHNELVTPLQALAPSPFKEGGVYELCAINTKSGSSKNLLEQVKKMTTVQEGILQENQSGKLISLLTTQIGQNNIVYQLWNYGKIDDLLTCKDAMNDHPSSEGINSVIQSVQTKLLVPLLPISPLT